MKPFRLCYIRHVSGDWESARILKSSKATQQAGNIDILTARGELLTNVLRATIVRKFQSHPEKCRRYYTRSTRLRDGAHFEAGMWINCGLIFGFFRDCSGRPWARVIGYIADKDFNQEPSFDNNRVRDIPLEVLHWLDRMNFFKEECLRFLVAMLWNLNRIIISREPGDVRSNH
jgi:hypothetical protein